MDQDGRLLTILSDNPSSLYSFIRASKNTSQTLIEKLTVQDKVYLGDKVAAGFYDAMTSLKNCDETELLSNPSILIFNLETEQFYFKKDSKRFIFTRFSTIYFAYIHAFFSCLQLNGFELTEL